MKNLETQVRKEVLEVKIKYTEKALNCLTEFNSTSKFCPFLKLRIDLRNDLSKFKFNLLMCQ